MLLGWALTFVLIAIAASLLGFTTVAQTASTLAKVLFFIFFLFLLIPLLILALLF